LSPRVKVGKKVVIRYGSEFGQNIIIGDYSYISGPRSYVEEARIGKYTSIARQVTIGVSNHDLTSISTHPFLYDSFYNFVQKNIRQEQKDAPIIGNDVWVGMNSIIQRGVIVGDGAVVAAGSIVTHDVEPYTIVGGIPAKFIRHRFSKEIVEKLLSIKWWNWEEEKIKENIKYFYDTNLFVDRFYQNVEITDKNHD